MEPNGIVELIKDLSEAETEQLDEALKANSHYRLAIHKHGQPVVFANGDPVPPDPTHPPHP